MMTGETTKMPGPEYLGDGVYAATDGYNITLHLGTHNTKPVIFLDPDVMVKLIGYWNAMHGGVLEFRSVRKIIGA